MNSFLILNSKCEHIITQIYKNVDDSFDECINKFKAHITSNNALYDTNCVLLIGNYSFIFMKHNDIILCGITNTNCNAFNILSLEHQFIQRIQSYSRNEQITAQHIEENIILILEILNEMIDGGYPQQIYDDFLIHPIPIAKKPTALEQARQSREILCQVTGSIPWRREGIKHNMGFSVGGAKDISTFRDCIQKHIFPKASSLTYNGLFYDYYFQNILQKDINPKEVKEQEDVQDAEGVNTLFYPSYCYAKCDGDYYLSVGLNSNIKTDEFKRNRLNLLLLLDISGSMRAPFPQNNKINDMIEDDETGEMSKMDVAKNCLIDLISKHIHDDDRLSIVLFNHNVTILQEFVYYKEMNKDAVIQKIKGIKATGGTNLGNAYNNATALFDSIKHMNTDAYDNRVIYLTDAKNNLSYHECKDWIDSAKIYSTKSLEEGRICTTFIGVGIDFNTDLVNKITSELYGANYYAVHSAADFNKRMMDEFDLMVTPLIFNLKLQINQEGNDREYYIDKIYGHTNEDKTDGSGELMKIKTLFPSRCDATNAVKGGIIIVKICPFIADDDIPIHMELNVTYQDRFGTTYWNKERICFDKHMQHKLYYDNVGIRKAIVLIKYAQLLKEWIADNTSFYVSKWYRLKFETFLKYIESEMKYINDTTLQKEADILKKLIHYANSILQVKPGYLPLWRNNEISLQVIETINIVINNRNYAGNKILFAKCKGKILMNSSLSGMPQIKMGLNIHRNNRLNVGRLRGSRKVSCKITTDFLDWRFHQCIRLHSFDKTKEITFIPPDGQFELLKYDINDFSKINVPFDVVVHRMDYASDDIEYDITLEPRFESQVVVKNIMVRIPVGVKDDRIGKNGLESNMGECVVEKDCLVWCIGGLYSDQKARLYGKLGLQNGLDKSTKQRGCNGEFDSNSISVQFRMDHKILSSMRIMYVDVMEPKMGYKTFKKVQYITETDDVNNIKFKMNV